MPSMLAKRSTALWERATSANTCVTWQLGSMGPFSSELRDHDVALKKSSSAWNTGLLHSSQAIASKC
eukprot:790844-Amphidinium_carterae.1